MMGGSHDATVFAEVGLLGCAHWSLGVGDGKMPARKGRLQQQADSDSLYLPRALAQTACSDTTQMVPGQARLGGIKGAKRLHPTARHRVGRASRVPHLTPA